MNDDDCKSLDKFMKEKQEAKNGKKPTPAGVIQQDRPKTPRGGKGEKIKTPRSEKKEKKEKKNKK